MIPRRRCVAIDEARPYFDAIEAEAEVPAFSEEVLNEVDRVLAGTPAAVVENSARWPDRTDLDFVTLDPEGSKDLDQAMCIQRAGEGFRVVYAIADLGAFVRPGGALDDATRTRGSTIYLPDRRLPLHPTELSEGAASLLPNVVRPAVVWDLQLDGAGRVRSLEVNRARIRSRGAYAYDEVQRNLEAGTALEVFRVLREVGMLREELERHRGSINLALPDQELRKTQHGWLLEYRAPLPVEDWNAQISLMVGMEAARIMVDAGVGLLRVMPPPDSATIQWLRGIANVLGITWPNDSTFQEVVRGENGTTPKSAAFITQAARLLRGAGYEAIAGPGLGNEQSAVAAPYAHVTAPLRRLGDRFNNEIILALHAGEAPPAWAVGALGTLPDDLTAAGRKSSKVEHAVVDLIEALLLERSVGATLSGWVVNTDHRNPRIDVQIEEPAIMARVVAPGARLGQQIALRVNATDPLRRTVDLGLAEVSAHGITT